MLDLSNNEIEEVETKQLPANLLALKLIGNPVYTNASKQMSKYRKPIVLALELLEDLDKIEILPVERMTYQGIIKDKRYKIDEVLVEQNSRAEMVKQGQKV